jgi:hypothetical protein
MGSGLAITADAPPDKNERGAIGGRPAAGAVLLRVAAG